MGKMERQTGEAAGHIWHALNANGPMSRSKISKITGLPTQLTNEGIGWLVREGKLSLETKRKRELVMLKE